MGLRSEHEDCALAIAEAWAFMARKERHVSPHAAPAISLIVPTFQRTVELGALFASLIGQSDKRFELIIVDQNKDDRLLSLIEGVKAAGLTVTHVKLQVEGATIARNAGFAYAAGELVAFPDDDCWYEPDVIEKVIGHFASEPGLSGLVAHWVEQDPQQLRPDGCISPDSCRTFRMGSVACFALVFRLDLLRAVNGFSDYLGPGRFFGAAEEEDLIIRLLRRDAKIRYVADVHIHHHHAEPPLLTRKQCRRNRLYGRGTGAVQAKHRLSAWVIGRSLLGPYFNALRMPNPASALVLGTLTVWGRIEGLAGWWLWRRRLLRCETTME